MTHAQQYMLLRVLEGWPSFQFGVLLWILQSFLRGIAYFAIHAECLVLLLLGYCCRDHVLNTTARKEGPCEVSENTQSQTGKLLHRSMGYGPRQYV